MFFSGKPSQRKVDLRGKSQAQESREDLLRKAREQREQRQKDKQKTKSAVCIQSHWRQFATARSASSSLRQSWAHLCGTAGSRQALQQLFASDPRLLSALLYCYDPRQQADREALAAVCSTLTASASAGSCALLAAAASATAATSSRVPSEEQLALFRVQKLALLCLSTLAQGGVDAAAALNCPYASLPSMQQQQPQATAIPMVDFLIRSVNPDAWQASIQRAAIQHGQAAAADATTAAASAATAGAGAAAVLRHLFSKRLTLLLRMLLAAAAQQQQSNSSEKASKTAAEVCATQMVVRLLQLQMLPVKLSPTTQQQPQSSAGVTPASPTSATAAAAASAPSPDSPAAAADTAVWLGATQLLLVPGLSTKVPSLLPVAGRLCGTVLGELGQLHSSKQLTDLVLQSAAATQTSINSSSRGRSTQAPPTGAAAAAAADAAAVSLAALADNFIEAAAAGTLFKGLSAHEQVGTAGKLVSTLVMLLESARQVSALQRRHWRSKQHRQQQHKSHGRSIYDTGSGSGVSRKAGYVPGAGFVGGAAGAQGAAAQQPMEVDTVDLTVQEAEQTPTHLAAAAAGGGGGGVAAAGGGAGAEEEAAAVAMEVDGAPPAAVPPQAAAAEAGSSQAAAAPTPDKQTAAVLEQPVAASAWSAEDQQGSKQSEVTAIDACMRHLAGSAKGSQLLRLLVSTLLPATTAAEARTLHQQLAAATTSTSPQPSAPSAAALMLPPGCPVQHQLLELIWSLSKAAEFRQKVWLSLSVGARLVPRLWCSMVLPLHLSTPGGLVYYTGNGSSGGRSGSSGGLTSPGQGSSSTATAAGAGGASSSGIVSGGGTGSWVLPMLVLCQAFNAALSFTHVEDFHTPDGTPALLPLSQLYDTAAPAAGLVLLLKTAVWQVLWFNSVSPPGLPPPPPGMQQHQLKASVAEVCGLLLCQLHDRNCLRQFCPPSAFLCELALTAPSMLQAELAAAAARMGAQGDDSDGDGAEDHAWQQQQQWQQQRQQGLAGPLAGGAVSTAAAGAGGGGSGGGGAGGSAAAAASGAADSLDDDGAVGVAGVGGSSSGGAAAGGGGGGRAPGSRVWSLLEHAPCLVPFESRVQLLQHVLEEEKQVAVESDEVSHMWENPLDFMQNRFVTIRREQLMEDGFTQIGRLDPDRIKGRLRIQYVNEAGLPEAGIDGGGLFKDFMEELLRQGFSPQSHLMAENPQHQLYPNPAAFAKYPDAEHRLGFLGRMLGKCLYEGMLLELPLAAFFLKKMRGGVCDVNDMPSLDPEVYKHLLQLRHYQGDFADLSLTFTATVVDSSSSSSFGANSGTSTSTTQRQREVELKPRGRDIAVAADNVIEYIHRLADFRLNRQMDRAAAAFLRGFFGLIKPRWVRMFNEAELQMLISGSEEGVDVDDLMQHINYAGGYHEEHPVIITLWETLRGFSPQQQRQFLKFVTSCSRAPLLGFAYLEPRVCVQMSGGMLQAGATQRLPTAATCMNLLKLPPYRTVKEMRDKLLYAVNAGAGFELS